MAEASQDPALDQADDWAQFINLDEDADEDGQPQAEQANGTGDQQVTFLTSNWCYGEVIKLKT